MGCIPFNAYDKHKMKARYFLSAFQIVKEPKCSDLEKALAFIPSLIGIVSNLVLPILGSLVAGYASDAVTKNISVDKLKKGVDLNANNDLRKFFDSQDPDFHMHVIIWALHDAFIKKNTHHGNLEKKFDSGTLSKEQLNYMFFIKQFVDPRKIDYNVTPYITESEIISYVNRVIQGHRSTEDYESFKTQAVGITKIINDINVIQYKEGEPNNGKKYSQAFEEIKKKPFGLITAALGLYFTMKK